MPIVENWSEPLERAIVAKLSSSVNRNYETLRQAQQLAALLDGKLAASRPLVDNGWLAHEKQIGQSGATIKPRYIFNVAISGSVQYQVGMQNAGCVISINHTKGAPIFDISHYGAVADYKTVIPALVEEIKRRKA